MGLPVIGQGGKPLLNETGIPALCGADSCCSDKADCEDTITKTVQC